MKGALELCRNNTFVIAQAAEDFRTALSRHRELESFIMDGKLSLCIRREKRSNNFAAIQASPENILEILRKNALMARHYFRVEPHGSLCVANMGCLCWAEDITIGGEREHVLYIRTGRMYCFANIQELNEFAGLGGKNAKCFQEQYSLMYGSCEDYKLELLLLRKLGSGSEGTVHMVKVMDLKPFQGASSGNQAATTSRGPTTDSEDLVIANYRTRFFALKIYTIRLDQELSLEEVLGHNRGEKEHEHSQLGTLNESVVRVYQILRIAPDPTLEISWHGAHCGILMEYMDGSLDDVLRKESDKPVSHTDALLKKSLDLMEQLAVALQVFHDNKKCHGDLKPENVLYKHNRSTDSGLQLKLADLSAMMCTPLYSPSERKLKPESDVNALGLMFFFLVQWRVGPGCRKMPQELKTLIEEMLGASEKRPGVGDVVKSLQETRRLQMARNDERLHKIWNSSDREISEGQELRLTKLEVCIYQETMTRFTLVPETFELLKKQVQEIVTDYRRDSNHRIHSYKYFDDKDKWYYEVRGGCGGNYDEVMRQVKRSGSLNIKVCLERNNVSHVHVA